jgi:phage tail-like protein
MHHSRIVVNLVILFVVAVGWSGTLCAQTPSSFMVAVEPEGMPPMLFEELSNLGSENEIVETSVTDPSTGVTTVLKIPGRLRYFDITLSRGITSSLDIWSWRQQIVDGDLSNGRKDVTVTVHDAGGNPVASWACSTCWPSEIEARLESGEAVAVERLVVTCDEIERVAK